MNDKDFSIKLKASVKLLREMGPRKPVGYVDEFLATPNYSWG